MSVTMIFIMINGDIISWWIGKFNSAVVGVGCRRISLIIPWFFSQWFSPENHNWLAQPMDNTTLCSNNCNFINSSPLLSCTQRLFHVRSCTHIKQQMMLLLQWLLLNSWRVLQTRQSQLLYLGLFLVGTTTISKAFPSHPCLRFCKAVWITRPPP